MNFKSLIPGKNVFPVTPWHVNILLTKWMKAQRKKNIYEPGKGFLVRRYQFIPCSDYLSIWRVVGARKKFDSVLEQQPITKSLQLP